MKHKIIENEWELTKIWYCHIPLNPQVRVRCCTGMAISNLYPYPCIPMNKQEWWGKNEFIQFTGHVSQGFSKQRNVTLVTPLLKNWWNEILVTGLHHPNFGGVLCAPGEFLPMLCVTHTFWWIGKSTSRVMCHKGWWIEWISTVSAKRNDECKYAPAQCHVWCLHTRYPTLGTLQTVRICGGV